MGASNFLPVKRNTVLLFSPNPAVKKALKIEYFYIIGIFFKVGWVFYPLGKAVLFDPAPDLAPDLAPDPY